MILLKLRHISKTIHQITTVHGKFLLSWLIILEGNPSYGLCHALSALPRLFGWSSMLDYIFQISLDHCLLHSKGTMRKIFNRFPAITFKRNMGMVLPRPFGWSGMFEKIFKNILDHSLVDAKGIMEKYSSMFL